MQSPAGLESPDTQQNLEEFATVIRRISSAAADGVVQQFEGRYASPFRQKVQELTAQKHTERRDHLSRRGAPVFAPPVM